MYYLRKLERPSSLGRIRLADNLQEVCSDVLHLEFRSKENSLSFWFASSKEEIKEVTLAIALSSSKIDHFRFVVFLDDLLDLSVIETTQTIGKTGYRKFQNNHVDFKNLNYNKIGSLVNIYLKTVDTDATGEIELSKQEIILRVKNMETDELDFDGMNSEMIKEVKKIRDN